MNFKTPILVILFNRSNNAEQLFESIKKLKPNKIYINIDGPRINNHNDITEVEKCKDIFSKIDWDCIIEKQYHKENLGCKNSVISALNWIFEKEEKAIILEDDCIPCLSFFHFCNDMLIKYEDDKRVMQISGSNFININNSDNCYFSSINDIWGWATWKRAWLMYDLQMKDHQKLIEQNIIFNYTKNNKIANWLKIYIEDALMPGSTTWSTQWTYAMIKNNGLTIVPPKNLVENIGFTGPSTHGQSKSWKHYSSFKANTINNYKCPEFIYPNLFLDKLRYKLIRKTDPNLFLISKLKRFVKNILIKKINLFN